MNKKRKERKGNARIEVGRSRSDLISYYFYERSLLRTKNNEDRLILRDEKVESHVRTIIVHLRGESSIIISRRSRKWYRKVDR